MKTVNLNGIEVPYILERKAVKNINMRIKSDGIIYISAKKSIPEKYILEIIQKNKDSIVSVLEKFKERSEKSSDITITKYLGEEYPVEVTEDSVESVDFISGKFIVHTADVNNIENVQYLILKWKSERCMELYKKINNYVYQDFIAHNYNVPLSVVTIKLMKSRWGSCNVKSGRISMNLHLADYPLGCIYGVFYHEYMHYIHPNHSADFHRDLNRIYPEYEKFNRILKD